MQKRIIILTSTHDTKDDRLFYHFASSLCKEGFEVQITSSRELISGKEGGIYLNSFDSEKLSRKEKIDAFQDQLKRFNPQLAICCEPLTVYSVAQYNKKTTNKIQLVFDITEWYPSKKNLSLTSWVNKPFKFLAFTLFFFWNLHYVDALIFGEYYKSLLPRILSPFKKHTLITYYTNLDYITYLKHLNEIDKIVICYTGKLSKEKGFEYFLNVADALHKDGEKNLSLKIIGWYASEADRKYFENILESLPNSIEILQFEKVDYLDFSKVICDATIYLDLREPDLENNHCLPIKIFFYAAQGRPVIYSNLKSIRRDVKINDFGYLVNPNDIGGIVKLIQNYRINPELYKLHCANARRLAETTYNWKMIEGKFIHFIKTQFES